MASERFFELARQHFAYLSDECAFQVVREESFAGFDSARQIWQSQGCRISVWLERGQVLVVCGPSDQSDEWYDALDVIEYLTGGREKWAYEFPHEKGDYEYRVEWQLGRLARMLRPYCDRICLLFSPEVFPETRRELRRLMGLER